MRIAHLLLVHTNPEQVGFLIDRLRDDEADIYVHLDKKADAAPFLHLQKRHGVYFIRNRIDVQWGTYSCVACTLASLEEINKSGRTYDFLNLLSGQDLPVKPLKDFRTFLSRNRGSSFLHALHIDTDWKEAKERLSFYDVGYFYKGNGRYKISEILLRLKRRTRPEGIEFYGRSQWFTLNMEHALFVVDYLKSHAKLRRFFQFTWGADELVFQTVLMNSKYQSDIVNDNLRYIDWSEGNPSPKTFGLEDKKAILSSGAYFARKFDLVKSKELIRELDFVTDFSSAK